MDKNPTHRAELQSQIQMFRTVHDTASLGRITFCAEENCCQKFSSDVTTARASSLGTEGKLATTTVFHAPIITGLFWSSLISKWRLCIANPAGDLSIHTAAVWHCVKAR
jgi:hypothetical protein